MVKIDRAPPLLGEMRTVPVKIIERQPHSFCSKLRLKFVRQPRFARTAAPDDCNQLWFKFFQKSFPSFLFDEDLTRL